LLLFAILGFYTHPEENAHPPLLKNVEHYIRSKKTVVFTTTLCTTAKAAALCFSMTLKNPCFFLKQGFSA
jgi:hypothetical protein